ncbi:MAG: hypothetical protein R3B70_18410 [Polyangiaceae bacterium]
MQVLAISKMLPGATPEKVNALAVAEAQKGWDLYKAGVVRNWYFRTDMPGAVVMLECESVDAARAIFAEAPLVKAGLIDFDYIPLGPYVPLEALFAR